MTPGGNVTPGGMVRIVSLGGSVGSVYGGNVTPGGKVKPGGNVTPGGSVFIVAPGGPVTPDMNRFV